MRAADAADRTGLRLVLIAEEAAGARVLRLLSERRLLPVCVLTDGVGARSEGLAPVARLARLHGLPLMPARRAREGAFADWLERQRVDLLLNVHSLHVLPRAVVEAPRIGALNLHPGPLPELAGLNAPSWAIFLRRPEHGVTLHWMDAAIDAGPVAYEERFALTGQERAFQLAARCAELGVGLIARLLDDLEAGRPLPRHVQDRARRRLLPPAPPEGTELVWERPAADLEALVRACDWGPFPSPWGHAWTRLPDGRQIAVLRARAVEQPTGAPTAAPPGTVLAVTDRCALVAAGRDTLQLSQLRIADRVVEARKALRAGDVLGA